MVQLVSGCNKEGYFHALVKSFSLCLKPSKAAFCKRRQGISFLFFKDLLFQLLIGVDTQRTAFHGLRIYAVDGMELHLPRTPDIVNAGYNGRATSKYKESYTPRMYLVHAYDVLSGITKDVRESPYLDELHGAKNMVKHFEKNSLTLYDRLYISGKMILAHNFAGNYFVMRARRSSFKEIREYFGSQRRLGKVIEIEGVKIKMFKVKNPKTNEVSVFITNLMAPWMSTKMIQKIYLKRWEVEVSFKDLADTMKMEQWHSTEINGIRQEFYLRFWLMNFAKIQILRCQKAVKITQSEEYEKPNFKLIVDWIKLRIGKIIKQARGLLAQIRELIRMSTEARKHYSRSYPREIRGPASPYPYNNTIWNI